MDETRPAYVEGFDAQGTYRAQSTVTPTTDERNTLCTMPSPYVMPIIFVPGIMGSNLKAKSDVMRGNTKLLNKGEMLWRVDGTDSMLSWLTRPPEDYQIRLQYGIAEVDKSGRIPVGTFSGTTNYAKLTIEQARTRGWGSVAAMFYVDYLDWLEAQLNASNNTDDDGRAACDKLRQMLQKPVHGLVRPEGGLLEEDFKPLLRFDNPVHACGYNWLQSNADSGKDLAEYIDRTIESYRSKGRQCDKVILVTHSMGGLVARAACKLHGAESKVAGVFHGVMPTDGAAATYKRMVAGFAGEKAEPHGGLFGWLLDWLGGIKESASANILGPRGNFTTPALALNPGPLELLPCSRYGDGKPWLFVKDDRGNVVSLPKSGDPYVEIYLERKPWFRMFNVEWANPAKLELPRINGDYIVAVKSARDYHLSIQEAGDFHSETHAHYGFDTGHKAYGSVTWELSGVPEGATLESLTRANPGGGEIPPDADMDIDLKQLECKSADGSCHAVRARLSQPDAAGDGTVPAEASARAVEAGVPPGNLLVRNRGYSHDASYGNLAANMGGRIPSLHAIVRILGKQPQPDC